MMKKTNQPRSPIVPGRIGTPWTGVAIKDLLARSKAMKKEAKGKKMCTTCGKLPSGHIPKHKLSFHKPPKKDFPGKSRNKALEAKKESKQKASKHHSFPFSRRKDNND